MGGTHHASHDNRLTNEDLAPSVTRTWQWKDYLFLWMSDIHSVAGYITVGSLFTLGLPLYDVFAALLFAILLVQLTCNLMAVPSFKTGAPFPVIARMTFGVYGAIIPALIRGIIAVGWYGIQTWLASNASVILILKIWPVVEPWANATHHGFLGLSYVGWLAFLIVWALQTLVFWNGMDAIRHFIDWAGPVIYGLMALLDIWLFSKTGWHLSFQFFAPHQSISLIAHTLGIINAMALILAFFAPIILNFGDFSRYGTSMQSINRGNFWGLPFNFFAFSLLTLVTITLTLPVFGHMIFDPVETVVKTTSLGTAIVGVITIVIATIGINISANFVSAAFDFSNMAPHLLSWRKGGLIAAIGAILFTPWNLYARPELIHLTLDVLGTFITPLIGIILADYYLIKKQNIVTEALYSSDKRNVYWYKSGFNPIALLSLFISTGCGVLFIFLPSLESVRNFSCLFGFVIGLLAQTLLSSLIPHQYRLKQPTA